MPKADLIAFAWSKRAQVLSVLVIAISSKGTVDGAYRLFTAFLSFGSAWADGDYVRVALIAASLAADIFDVAKDVLDVLTRARSLQPPKI